MLPHQDAASANLRLKAAASDLLASVLSMCESSMMFGLPGGIRGVLSISSTNGFCHNEYV